MLEVFYEDNDIIVVKKPVGMESQSVHSFAPDLVSEIRKHINRLSTNGKEPYVGVIHRLDKPVGGIMVYAKTKKAAASLSKQVQNHQMQKEYMAVVCGKPVDNVGNFVDYLLKDERQNVSKIVDKGINGAKRAELAYEVVDTLVEKRKIEEGKTEQGETEQEDQVLSLVKIRLLTGRHHQIRVQFAGHGFPLWGDGKYNPMCRRKEERPTRRNGQAHRRPGAPVPTVALSSCGLSFLHPATGKRMEFHMEPEGPGFIRFL